MSELFDDLRERLRTETPVHRGGERDGYQIEKRKYRSKQKGTGVKVGKLSLRKERVKDLSAPED